jgi:hypothetical protein
MNSTHSVQTTPVQIALCIRRGEDDDLELRKAYPTLPAASNETGFLRVVDESGEDYLYPTEYFIVIEVSRSVEEALLKAASPLHG